MKKNVYAIAVLSALLFMSFRFLSDNRGAKVKVNTPYLFFYQCEPTSDYKVLGEVHVPKVMWNGKLAECWKSLKERCTKEYPKADALIVDDNFTSAQCVVFKD